MNNIDFTTITFILLVIIIVPTKSAALLCQQNQRRSFYSDARDGNIFFTLSSHKRSSIHYDFISRAKDKIQLFVKAENDLTLYDDHRRTFLSNILLQSINSVLSTAFYPLSVFAEEEPIECKNGAIISESAVPGAYQQLCMDLPERRFSYIYQGASLGDGMAGRTGVAVWNSGILLTRFLDSLSVESPLLRGKAVLELGCGAALASVASAKLGAESVIATDANPEVIRLAQRNIERNGIQTIAKTAELHWGLMDAAEYAAAADVVIGSDLTYNSGSWLALAETMSIILKPGGLVIYVTLGHSGFNTEGEVGGFLSTVASKDLRLLTKESIEWTVRLKTLLSPNEKIVIDANGGARVILLSKKL